MKGSCQSLRFDPAPVFDMLVIIYGVFSDSFLHTVETPRKPEEWLQEAVQRVSQAFRLLSLDDASCTAAEFNKAKGRNRWIRPSNCDQDKI